MEPKIMNWLNILQQIDQLAYCKNICFEINPIFNLISGARKEMILGYQWRPYYWV